MVLKQGEKRGKPPELTKAAFSLVQKPDGPFLTGGSDKFTAFSAQKPFLLPSYTYSISPLLVPSRREHSVATWRARRGKAGARYTCV